MGKSYHTNRHRPNPRLTIHRRSISTSDLFNGRPSHEEPDRTSCLPNSSPHKLDPVQEEEKGEEGEEREEKEGAEEERSINDISKGVKNNGWREEHEEQKIETYHESENRAGIETSTTGSVVAAVRGVQNAGLDPERENAAESSELQKRNSLCTGDVQVHR